MRGGIAIGEPGAQPGLGQARSPASGYSGPRTLCAQSCTVVMPELIASAQASSVPWNTSPGPNAGPSPRQTRKYPGPVSDMPRSRVFHMCQCVSTRPGATIIPVASITLAPAGAARPVPTAAIAPSLTSTSPSGTSPVPGSMVIT